MATMERKKRRKQRKGSLEEMNGSNVDSGIRIPCENTLDFYEKWFQMLKPIHKLNATEIKVLSTFCKFRDELGRKIKDQRLLDEYLFSVEIKAKIREECGLSASGFQVSMHKLRKAGVMVDNRINPKLIPNVKGDKGYRLLLWFDYRNAGNGQLGEDI